MQKKICYDALSQVDFLTDIPLLISEVKDGKAKLVFANEIGLHQFQQDGFENLKALEDALNDSHNVVSRELGNAVLHVNEVKGGGETTTLFHGNKRLIRYQMLGVYEGARLYVSYIYGRSAGEDDSAFQTQLMMNLTYFYRNLFTVDTQDMTIRSLRFASQAITRSSVEPIRNGNGRYASVLPRIFEADQKKYDAFIDPATLLKRLQKAEYGILHAAFRTQGADGTYCWMSHRLLLVPNGGNWQILYVIHTMDSIDISGESSSKKILHPEEINQNLMYFDSLLRHLPIPVFWKDKERRFLGVNQLFLDYFGFTSADEIIGKTDEDMKWHPNSEAFTEDENEVIQSGEVHRNIPGRVISKGESRTVYSTKWPTFQDGKVSGLMCYFYAGGSHGFSHRRIRADSLSWAVSSEDPCKNDLLFIKVLFC